MKDSLYIQVESSSLTLNLMQGNKKLATSTNKTKKRSDELLVVIDSFLKRNQVLLSDLAKIRIKFNSDTLTGRRVKESIVNALGFALKIPVLIES